MPGAALQTLSIIIDIHLVILYLREDVRKLDGVGPVDNRPSTLLAKYADSVDLRDGLLNNKVCTVKFPAIESCFSIKITHTEVPSTRMDLEVW